MFFWFVQMIMVVYIIIFILNKLIDYKIVFLKLSGIFSVIFIILYNFNIIPIYSMPQSYIYFSIFAIFGYYLATYHFLSNRYLKSSFITKEILALIFLIFSVLLYLCEIYYTATTSIALNSYSSVNQFSFLNIALVFSVFLFFRYLFESKGKLNKIANYISNGNVGKIILSISFCSYGIYLCHSLLRDFFHVVINVRVYFSPSIYYSLLLFFTLICSWLLILIMSKMPILNKISGR